MVATTSVRGTLTPPGPGEPDVEDSNVSSPLTEVEYGEANDEDIGHMHMGARSNDADDSNASGDDQPEADTKNGASDSESALSDAHSVDHSEANDTEAETERLYDTPRNRRRRDVVVDQYNQGQTFEHTPSKLRSASRLIDDNDNNRDDESLSADDASVASGDDSPTKPFASKNTSADGEGKRDLQERKRKRSPMGDQSESDQPLRKRLTSLGAAETGADGDASIDDDDTTPAIFPSGDLSLGEEDDVSAENQDAPTDGERPEKGTRVSKKITRIGSKSKGGSGDISPSDTPGPDTNGEQIDIAEDEDAEQRNQDVEVDADEADLAAKSIEEAEKKNAAFKDWSHIEEMFCLFRDRLYKDRLQRLEEEEQSLLAPVPTHPEYLNMKQCLDDRFDKRVREINHELVFRIEAHERRAVAVRAQVWSQYFQAVREKREAVLESLNRQWYEVQTARRTAHSLPDYGLLFPKDPVQRVRNAVAYNTEVSTLAGIAKYEGFPAGPELKGASVAEVDADFAAIESDGAGKKVWLN
ncbi:Sds3-like protein [Metarhizium album ARSEF 1941]|uniref:Sds3-like protein n=1 Tax=Metarhizium album (strain ARSEF 1941) TaxID=1081103 RepID=A0A0B2X496_METAS|nr:Sds3-like protein [Metarhizium album ARSEF 1941]KHO00131.1 Sds3-like protein [Metarhizium album ARSEF 1941]